MDFISEELSHHHLLQRIGIAAFLLAGALALSGCIDTELGLVAEIEEADVVVRGTTLEFEIDVTYRVGAHAQGERYMFQPQSIDLYLGENLLAQATPELPSGFVSVLEAGESHRTTLRGTATGVGAAPTVCAAGEARILLRYLDPSMMVPQMTEYEGPTARCE